MYNKPLTKKQIFDLQFKWNYQSKHHRKNDTNWWDSGLYWTEICMKKDLSEDFMREYQDRLNWFAVSMYQNLSEDFIREFQDKVDWMYISASQNLSENFIDEFQNKVSWLAIIKNQKIESDWFIKKHREKLKKFEMKDRRVYYDD